jgi:hypothetical protein
MADDQNQSPYRSNETLTRATRTAASGSDPLAELARLIGQTNPFAGRDIARRAPAAQPSAPAASPYGAPDLERQPYAADDNLYQDEAETAGHPAADTDGFKPDSYHPSNGYIAGEENDVYEDVPPSKRRMGIMAIAAVFALAAIGTAGAFGYRALFGTSGPGQPPQVIKADTAPSNIVPATASNTPNKLITRVADHPQDGKLESREEQRVEMKQAAATSPQSSAPPASTQAALGSGVISSEPKKIRTIAIHPDQPSLGENQRAAATATAPAPPSPPPTRMAAPAPVNQAPPPPRVASSPPVAANPVPPPPRQTETRAVAPVQHTAASASGDAPRSPNPAAPATRAPTRTAAVAAPAPIARAAKPAVAAGGSYAVQVSSQRSEADTQAAFRSLQAKYPSQLGGRQALIHKVELGAKGTYYRAMVGPFATANEAGELCSGLKAAGGQCIVQKN